MKHADLIKRLIKEALSTPPKKDKCNCGCHSCENVGNPGPVLNESLNNRIIMTENMKYHVNNKLALTENTFRYGSDAFLKLWAEARYLYSRNAIHVNDLDKEIIIETDLGEYGIYEGQKVPLDLPMLEEKENNYYIIKFGFNDDGEYKVVNSKPIYAQNEEEAAYKLRDQFESYEGISIEIISIERSGLNEDQKVPLDLVLLEDEDIIGGKKDIEYAEIIPFRALSNLTKTVGEEIEILKAEEEKRGIDFTGDLQLLDKEDQKIVQKRLRMLNLLKDLDRLFSFENKNIHYNTVLGILKKYNALDLLSSVGAGLNEIELGNKEDIEMGIMSSYTPTINDLYKKAKTGDKQATKIYDELIQAITPEEKQQILNKYFPEKLNESTDKKHPALNKPKRGGSKKFYVYVRDPKTKRIKKVSFGDTTGLSAKINNPKARQAFAKRHDCANKKDKTKASYWSCRLPRYASLLGLKSTFSGYW